MHKAQAQNLTILFILIGSLLLGFQKIALCQSCKDHRALILLSSNFKPYGQAADIIADTLSMRCPEIDIKLKEIKEHDLLYLQRLKRSYKPSVIFPVGTEALVQSQEVFPEIPKIFSMVLDPPDEAINSQNTYGVVLSIDYKLEIKQLLELKPIIQTIGCLYSEDTEDIVKKLKDIVNYFGVNLFAIKLNSIKELEDKLKELFENADAIIAVPDTLIYNNIIAPRIIYSSIRFQKPFVGLSKKFTASGALFSIDCDYLDSARQAALMGIKVITKKAIKNPVEFCKDFTTYFNLRTARLIGLKVKPELLKNFTIISN